MYRMFSTLHWEEGGNARTSNGNTEVRKLYVSDVNERNGK